jgi:hypothetical protein
VSQLKKVLGLAYKPKSIPPSILNPWTLNKLYNPLNWNKALTDEISADYLVEYLKTHSSSDFFSAYIPKIEGLMDPDNDFIRNRDEEDSLNSLFMLKPDIADNTEARLKDLALQITQANPINIELNPDLSITCPFTGVLLLNSANPKLPYAKLKSDPNNYIDLGGNNILYICPNPVDPMKPIYVRAKNSSFPSP